MTYTEPVHQAELNTYLHHVAWAGDVVLLATSAETLTNMAADVMPAHAKAALKVNRGKPGIGVCADRVSLQRWGTGSRPRTTSHCAGSSRPLEGTPNSASA